MTRMDADEVDGLATSVEQTSLSTGLGRLLPVRRKPKLIRVHPR